MLPTKKELIYHIFRAAYPHGAFVDDNLNLAELRHKDVIWKNLETQIDTATTHLERFLETQSQEEPRLQSNPKMKAALKNYYVALLSEAYQALYVSQNGLYHEFRCMEEMLVRYRKADPEKWMNEPEQGQARYKLPRVEGFQFAEEHLVLQRGNDVSVCLHKLRELYSQPESDVSVR